MTPTHIPLTPLPLFPFYHTWGKKPKPAYIQLSTYSVFMLSCLIHLIFSLQIHDLRGPLVLPRNAIIFLY